MKDKGWTPDAETAYYRAGETTRGGGGVTPSDYESGEPFHPLGAVWREGWNPSQAPSSLEAPAWSFRMLIEAPLAETVGPDNGLQGHHTAATRSP
jgi:hypothetical protein